MFAPLIALGLAAVLNFACPQVPLGGSLPNSSEVKAAFNAARGKVRIVMLVSPT